MNPFSSRKEMGCAASKILARSWHFQEDVERRLKRRPAKGLEELVSYKNGAEHEKNSTMPVESNAVVHVETINTWDLLAGLAEDDDEEEDNDKTIEKEVTTNIDSKRKAMAKELSVLEVPPFEFAEKGSQKEWPQRDGQEPYVTPKFGKFSKQGDKREDEGVVFDPELVAQFERAMNELATDEELVLRQITNGLE
ncbi:hypothetical protein ZIOFF_068514 [Zingiber officinale]|uniref:Uncharacterized protein n=1 Tax=Zingiber officinale TaxID=94328 RepID=A0A8J5CH27_ZINOF|nr:hypothetical protein ZIOFF_068514 [Zingiber officinale]